MTTKAGEKYIEAVGKRKTSIARVRLTPSTNTTYTINDKKLEEYFVTDDTIRRVRRPLLVPTEKQSFKVTVKVVGGGISSQADAVAHGIARAMVKANSELKKSLKDGNLITRDARIKERRKFGLKKARKSAQWSKR